MAKDINIRTLFTADDQLSPQMLKIKQNTKDFISSERTQHRQLNYVLKETGGAAADLANVFGDSGKGLGKAINGVGGSASEFSFLLQGLNDTIGQGTGKVATFMKSLAPGGFAMVGLGIGAVVGGITMLKSALDADSEALKKNIEEAYKLKIALGLVPADLAKIHEHNLQLEEDARHTTWFQRSLDVFRNTGETAAGDARAAADKLHLENLKEEISLIKEQNAALDKVGMAHANNAIKEIEASLYSGTEKLDKEKEWSEAKLAIEYDADMRNLKSKAHTEDMVTNLKKEYHEKQIALDLDYDAKYHNEALKEEANFFRIRALQQAAAQRKEEFDKSFLGTGKPDVMKDEFGRTKSLSPIRTSPIPQDQIRSTIRDMEIMQRAAAEQWQQENIIAWIAIEGAVNQGGMQIAEMFDGVWKSIFSNANSDLDKFVLGVLGAIDQIAAKMLAEAAIFALVNLITGGGASAVAGLAGFFHFHEGGMIPKAHAGMDFRSVAPSKEFPVMVRGGEMVLTEAQQKAVGNQSITVNVSAIDVNSFRNMLRSTDMRSVLVQALSGQINSGRV